MVTKRHANLKKRMGTILHKCKKQKELPGILVQCSLNVVSVGRRGGGSLWLIPTPDATMPTLWWLMPTPDATIPTFLPP